jgi:3',5'-nucleoside bisphosphate phosphatase
VKELSSFLLKVHIISIISSHISTKIINMKKFNLFLVFTLTLHSLSNYDLSVSYDAYAYSLRPPAYVNNNKPALEDALHYSEAPSAIANFIFSPVSRKKRLPEKIKTRLDSLKSVVYKWGSSQEEVFSALAQLKAIEQEGYNICSKDYSGRVDMHMHSIYSDGQFRPAHVVMAYWLSGFTVISMTDHNTFDAMEEAINAAKILGIHFIPGVELTVFTDKVKAEKLHILLYWQGSNEEFLQWLESSQGQKDSQRLSAVNEKAKEKMALIIDEFNAKFAHRKQIEAYGTQLFLSPESINRLFPNRPSKTTDLARVLFDDYGPGGKIADNVLGVDDIHQAKHDFFKSIRVNLDDHGYNLTLEEAFDMVDDGIFKVVFAHPLIRGKWDLPQVRRIIELYPGRFAGLEVYHSKASNEHINLLKGLCDEFGLAFSVGSDLHGDFDKNFGTNCPSATAFGRLALEASVDTCSLLPQALLKEVMIGQLLYWAGLPLLDKTYSHILPIYSADNSELGKRDNYGSIISVTPEILEIIISKIQDKKFVKEALFLLQIILKNNNLDEASKRKISEVLTAYDKFPARLNVTKEYLDDAESFRLLKQEFILSLIMDSRFRDPEGFYERDLYVPLKTMYIFSKEAKAELLKRAVTGTARIIKPFQLKGRHKYVFVSKDYKPKNHTSDIDRLKRYYMELFDTALELFVYLGRRMQLKGSENEKQIHSLSKLVLKLRQLKQEYSQDTFFRDDFKNIANHTANRINRSIELIESRNEPAASKCIFGAINRILFLRKKFSKNIRYGYRKSNTLESDWDEFRQKTAIIDFEISDRRWVRKAHSVLKGISDTIYEKDYELSKEDILYIRDAIESLMDSSVKPGGVLIVEDKVVSLKFLKNISLMLAIGSRHIRTVRIFIELACRHLLLRGRDNIGIIDAVGGIKDPDIRMFLSLVASNRESHIDKISKRQDDRDRDIARQVDSMTDYLLRKDINSAKNILEKLTYERALNVEPEYASIDDIAEMLSQAIDSGNIRLAVYYSRKIKSIVKYAKDFRDMVVDYRQRLLSSEIVSEHPVERLDLLKDVYLDYLERHKKVKNSAKLSALYWAKLYQLANVPMVERSGSVREPYRLFEAISAYITLIKYDKIISIFGDALLKVESLDKTLGLIRRIHLKRDHIVREDLPDIIITIANDFNLSEEDRQDLKMCMWLTQRSSGKPISASEDAAPETHRAQEPIEKPAFFNAYRTYTSIRAAA